MHHTGCRSPVAQRVVKLRSYAWRNSDVVVLHTHPDDVVPTVAFGVPGGPPVLLVNHADHVFWVGCAVADLVLDFRASGHSWTKQARGVDRAVILPLPLPDLGTAGLRGSTSTAEKRLWRRKLGLPENGIMLLTVGTAVKYQAMPGLDFVANAVEILQRCGEAYLVAVGPRDEGAWKAARKNLGGRILALGRQPDSTLFCRAADIYLEGFPLGSVTALLEAGLAGLPCVRGPRECAPYTTDSLSVDAFPPPGDVSQYIETAVGLVKSPEARTGQGLRLQEAIQSDHCGAGWLSRLQVVKICIPKSHCVYPNFHPAEVEDKVRDWFLRFVFANGPAPTASTLVLPVFVEAWKRTDSTPQIDPALWAKLTACGPTVRKAAPGLDSPHESSSLSRLNRIIKRQGTRARLLARGRLALAAGKPGLARTLIYQCLRADVSCLARMDWIKLFIKAHSGRALSARLKRSFQWISHVHQKRVLKRA